MSHACRSFRALLERKLAGRPDPKSLRSLSWHDHLLSCAACRTLLDEEEALESLLATLPEPELPPDVRRRVLVALARSRATDGDLDRLLELDAGAAAPAGLAADVLARLARERAAASTTALDPLDALLERARPVDVPADLAPRVLSGLRLARRRRTVPVARLAAFVAAAALVVALTTWALWPRTTPAPVVVDDGPRGRGPSTVTSQGSPSSGDGVAVPSQDGGVATPEVDPQLLAALDALENWDLLVNEKVDVALSTLSTADEAVIEYEEGG